MADASPNNLALKPLILVLCHPLTGHVSPVLRLAALLHEQGWSVSFLSSAFFRPRIEAAGLRFLPLLGAAALDDTSLFPKSPLRTAGGAERPLVPSVIDSHHQTLDSVPAQWASVKSALAQLHREAPGRRVVVICEAFFYGSLPLKLGAPLPDGVPAPPTLCVSITAPAIRSVDLPPFCWPLPFDPSADGRRRNAAAWEEWETRVLPLTRALDARLLEAGSVRGVGEVFMGGGNYTLHDAILQIGLPGFEYPRSDPPGHFKLVGILPPTTAGERADLGWWVEIVANASLNERDPNRKKVVVVAQGTVETEPTELILPTMRHLEGQAHVLTVAILGSRGARLSPTVKVPHNARIADYLNYDAILRHADLWVHNGGYGATTHGISHGVPMVIAGEGQDKPESGKRVAYSGLGINLGCARPSIERLGEAINRVLEESCFVRAARQLSSVAARTNCVGLVQEEIFRLTAA